VTPDQFQATAIALLRSAVGWQSAIARRLGVDRKTVQRWLKGEGSPAWADDRLREMMGGADIAPWPRDEWVVGDALGGDGRRREYVVHVQPPRFVARIVAVDEAGDPLPQEEPCDVVSGAVYSSGDCLLCEIEWVDAVAPGEVARWLEAAADAVDDA